jgi:AmmeMemoRadiSam system protein A
VSALSLPVSFTVQRGYVVIFRYTDRKEAEMLNKEERKFLLQLVRDTIHARLKGKNLPVYKPQSDVLQELRGAFVTLHARGALRGCIGYVEAIKPLCQTVQEMAVAAAFQDPRFPALRENEYDNIEIEISVMSPLRRVRNVDEIEVGKHGIVIRRGFHSGLLLPQVATEQGWDRDTFLEHTCYKAGLPGDAWRKKDTEIQIFSAEVFSERKF